MSTRKEAGGQEATRRKSGSPKTRHVVKARGAGGQAHQAQHTARPEGGALSHQGQRGAGTATALSHVTHLCGQSVEPEPGHPHSPSPHLEQLQSKAFIPVRRFLTQLKLTGWSGSCSVPGRVRSTTPLSPRSSQSGGEKSLFARTSSGAGTPE